MTRKTAILMAVAMALAGLYVYYFTDWFSTPTIDIICQIRPPRTAYPRGSGQRGRREEPQQVNSVAFSFYGKWQLTMVKVVPADEYATNKYVKPLWHLVSTSNSGPKPAIIYGWPVAGMKPIIPGLRAEPLEPRKKYLLLVQAGKARGQTTFATREAPPLTP